jgi:hypothetical protein
VGGTCSANEVKGEKYILWLEKLERKLNEEDQDVDGWIKLSRIL